MHSIWACRAHRADETRTVIYRDSRVNFERDALEKCAGTQIMCTTSFPYKDFKVEVLENFLGDFDKWMLQTPGKAAFGICEPTTDLLPAIGVSIMTRKREN